MLRSIRYGEADRILHVYTHDRGRLSAIAKGARRTRSRFGARLEPFMQVALLLHEGRTELYTVTGADTIDARPGLRDSAAALDSAARSCDAVSRLFETDDPHPAVYALLANQLSLLAGSAARGGSGAEGRSGPAGAAGGAAVNHAANQVAFRLKLLLAAGIMPQLGSCAACGEREHLTGFSAAAGGVVCSSCESSAFTIDREAYEFLIGAVGSPLASTPAASPRALRIAERAVTETAAYHANVRLAPLPQAV